MGLTRAEKTVGLIEQRYPVGTQIFPDQPIPVESEGVTVSIDRSKLDAAVTGKAAIDVIVEVSLDGGATYPLKFGFTAPDGLCLKRDGSVSTESSVTFPLPEPKNPNRRIRGSMTNSADVKVSMSITVF